jgi:peptide/nickel transport system substrate-binding protein
MGGSNRDSGTTSGNSDPYATDSGSSDNADASGTGSATDNATVALQTDLTSDTWDVYGGVTPYYTNLIEPLIWVSDKMTLVPWLATDWTATGKKTWEFTLREDVTFHNGKPLTADAVVFSFKEILKEWSWTSGWLHIKPEGVRKIEDKTVEFETTAPFPTFPGTISHNMVAIQHPQRNRKKGEVIGTGPFKVTDRKKSQYIQTKRFDNYWNEKPNLSQLRFRVITDPTTRTLALQGNEIDVAYSPPTSKIKSLKQDEQTKVETQLSPSAGYAGLNIHKSPTDDTKLRQGLNWALSQQLLVQKVLNGIGVPAKGPIAKVIYWSAHEKLPAYGPNATKAKQLISESNYNGETLRLLVSNNQPQGRLISQVLQQAFDDVGVTVEIQVMEEAAYDDAVRNGNGHIILTESGSNSGAADYLIYETFHSKGDVNERLNRKHGTGLYNLGGSVDRLIEKGFQTGNRDVKERVYEQALQIIMQKAVVVPLYYGEYVVASRADIEGSDLRPIKEMVRWTQLTDSTQK